MAGWQDCGLRIARSILACALLLGVGAGAVRAEEIDRVLAVVGGQLILLSDVNAARDLGLVLPGPSAPDPIREVLSRLIDRELQLAEVERYAPREPTTEELDGAIRNVRVRFTSQEAFDAALARAGIDLLRLQEWLRDDLRLQAYLDQRFARAGDRRQRLIDEWIAGLRRRTATLDLYLVGA